jgi:hypothetical protein
MNLSGQRQRRGGVGEHGVEVLAKSGMAGVAGRGEQGIHRGSFQSEESEAGG